jgi:hypothetical protein
LAARRQEVTMMRKSTISRRQATKLVATAAVLAAGKALAAPGMVWASRLQANDRIRLGVIVYGGMGTRHLEALSVNPHCDVAAVYDCFTPRYENAIAVVKRFSGKAPDGYHDFRRVLDRPDLDAIFAPTPDHRHPLMVILGCQSRKDIYVEKPASPTVAEGRATVEAPP